jgi:RNA polymerase sigma-70 factor (ECF subfamily)
MTGKVLYLHRVDGDLAEPSDEELLAACGEGDAAALGALFDRHHRAVFRFLSRLNGSHGSDLDDLVQTTFLQVRSASRHFARKASVRTWLLGVAANVVRHHLRGEARRRRLLQALGDVSRCSCDGPHENLEGRRQIEKLAVSLHDLPTKLKVVFVMCDLEGVQGVEAARILGLREGTLWRRLHEARKALAKAIERIDV